LWAFLLSIAALGVLYLLLNRTRFGRAIRATVQNPESARLLGVEASRVSALGFGLGAATAAAAGSVYGLLYPFNSGSHYDLISRLLTIIVLGGLGSLRGAIIGAVVMLIVEDLASVVVSPVWASFAFFVILVAVLVVRPQGLYGIRVRERI
jgi:branched-chain amino acid transport system permease protein